MTEEKTKVAIFGGGCFWCLDPIFSKTKGVINAIPGYSGGETEDPTYKQVQSGSSGHAQVIKVEYDPSVITYEELIKLFFASHDATTLNKQMHEQGSQYRSIILYLDEDQKKIAEEVRDNLAKLIHGGEIVTEIVPFEKFYEAEEEHHDYFKKNPEKSSCCLVGETKS